MSHAYAVLIVSLLLVGPVAAQENVIALGQTFEGALEETDSVDVEGYRYDAIRLEPGPGERVLLTLEAEDFDPYLQLGIVTGGEFQQLAYQDESPVDTSPGALGLFVPVTRAPWADGELVVRVSGAETDAEGRYTLRLLQAAPAESDPTVLTVPARVQGALTETDAMEYLTFQDLYRFQGRAGRRIMAGMTGDFDAFLYLRRVDGEQVTELARDDDGWGGADAFIEADLREDGEYEIVASSYSQGFGEYELEIWDAPRLVPPIDHKPVLQPGPGASSSLDVTEEERNALVVEDSVVRNDALGFRAPTPASGFSIRPGATLALMGQEMASNAAAWMIQDAEETVVILIAAFKTPVLTQGFFTAFTQLLFETWRTEVVDADWAAATAPTVDWSSRSVVWSVVDPTPTEPDAPNRIDVRCEATRPERSPGLVACLFGIAVEDIGLQDVFEGLEIRAPNDR